VTVCLGVSERCDYWGADTKVLLPRRIWWQVRTSRLVFPILARDRPAIADFAGEGIFEGIGYW